MLQILERFIKGYIRIKVDGFYIEKLLNACGRNDIRIWNLHMDKDAFVMYICIKDFFRIKGIIKRLRIKIRVLDRKGFPFLFKRYRKKYAFIAGILTFFVINLYCSQVVWEIDISGNKSLTDESVQEFLLKEGIRKGMLVKNLDCANTASLIRSEFADIIWVSAYLDGTKCCIEIKENEHPVKKKESKRSDWRGTDIVADRDYIVKDIVIRKGMGIVKAGQRVSKGDVLVSGAVPILNDAGEITSYRYVDSDADIRGEYEISYNHELDREYCKKDYWDVKKENYYLKVNDYRLALGSTRNRYLHCETTVFEKDFMNWGVFYGVFAVGREECIPYDYVKNKYSDDEMCRMLSDDFYRYIEDLKKKKVEIIRNNVKIYRGQAKAEARGSITCVADAGVLQECPEQTVRSGEEEWE